MHNKVILIVEDDAQISNFMCYILEQEGYDYQTAQTGKEALRILRQQQIDMILLDLGLPDMDGKRIVEEVRSHSELPIIIVSARDQEQEKAEVLDEGADDYLTKPFSVTELSARIRVAFRHAARLESSVEQQIYEAGELRLDIEKHRVFLQDKELHLTPLEYNLLALFLKNAGKVLTTQYILREIYGIRYGTDTQALRALIAGLRRKIEENPGKPQYIITEIGVGYRLYDE